MQYHTVVEVWCVAFSEQITTPKMQTMLASFDKSVNDFTGKGWTTSGGISITIFDNRVVIAQALVRNEDKEWL